MAPTPPSATAEPFEFTSIAPTPGVTSQESGWTPHCGLPVPCDLSRLHGSESGVARFLTQQQQSQVYCLFFRRLIHIALRASFFFSSSAILCTSGPVWPPRRVERGDAYALDLLSGILPRDPHNFCPHVRPAKLRAGEQQTLPFRIIWYEMVAVLFCVWNKNGAHKTAQTTLRGRRIARKMPVVLGTRTRVGHMSSC